MFKTAMLALDLSPAEEPLLDCIPELLKWGVERLVIVHLVRAGYVQGPSYHQLEDATAWLEWRAAPLRAAGLQVEVSVRKADVSADEILAAAAEAGVDLLVAGSRSQNLASRLFLGSVARDLVRKTPLPLLLHWIEPDVQSTGFSAVCTETLRHVMLATDLSRHASAAEQAAVALAGHASRIVCLTVLTRRAMDDTPALTLMTRAALDALVRQIEANGGHGEALVLEGEPIAVIGSTALRLCESAGRPVLLVPLPDEQ